MEYTTPSRGVHLERSPLGHPHARMQEVNQRTPSDALSANLFAQNSGQKPTARVQPTDSKLLQINYELSELIVRLEGALDDIQARDDRSYD